MPDGAVLEVATSQHKEYALQHLGRALLPGEDVVEAYQLATGAISFTSYGMGKVAIVMVKPTAAQQQILDNLQAKYMGMDIRNRVQAR